MKKSKWERRVIIAALAVLAATLLVAAWERLRPGNAVHVANYRLVQPGMTVEQVEAILGKPGKYALLPLPDYQWSEASLKEGVYDRGAPGPTRTWSTGEIHIRLLFDAGDRVETKSLSKAAGWLARVRGFLRL